MISIITCSIKPDICQKMLESVSKIIGTEYEVIVFDNREKKYGICKAYNEAAKEANGDKKLCKINSCLFFYFLLLYIFIIFFQKVKEYIKNFLL